MVAGFPKYRNKILKIEGMQRIFRIKGKATQRKTLNLSISKTNKNHEKSGQLLFSLESIGFNNCNVLCIQTRSSQGKK